MIELTDSQTGETFCLNAWFVLEVKQVADNVVQIKMDTGGYRQVTGTVGAICALINKVIL